MADSLASANNSSLQNASQQLDPFQQTRGAQINSGALGGQADGNILAGMFTLPTSGAESGAPAAPQPSLKDMQQPISALKFPDIAKQMGLSTQGLAPDKEVGGLQLMKRLQGQLGPNFQNHPAFLPMMKAWQQHASQFPANAMQGSTATATRTLQGLMGGPP